MLPAGELPDRVSVEVRTEVTSGDRVTETWAVRHRRWSARVRELVGRDLERAQQVDPRISIEVLFRYWRAFRDDLDGGRTRLIVHETSNADDDRVLEIVGAPIESHRKAHVLVMCREAA